MVGRSRRRLAPRTNMPARVVAESPYSLSRLVRRLDYLSKSRRMDGTTFDGDSSQLDRFSRHERARPSRPLNHRQTAPNLRPFINLDVILSKPKRQRSFSFFKLQLSNPSMSFKLAPGDTPLPGYTVRRGLGLGDSEKFTSLFPMPGKKSRSNAFIGTSALSFVERNSASIFDIRI